MKSKSIIVILLMCVMGVLQAQIAEQKKSPEAKITVKVTGEDGQPIEKAKVGISFEYYENGTKQREKEGLTDSSGLFSTSEQTSNGYVCAGAIKDGYYGTIGDPYRGVGPKDGKWQPYNPTQTFVLKKIIKPIPMYAKKTELKIHDIGKPIGYDLMAGDLVAPYGSGKVKDFIFTVSHNYVDRNENTGTMDLTLSNPNDGLLPVSIPYNPSSGSKLRMPHQAILTGYQPNLHKELIRRLKEPNRLFKDDTIIDMNYFIRVRTLINEKGEIVSAYYGKIHGDFLFSPAYVDSCFIRFRYYLNPTPNDRNVEFDPKQNLFKDLQSFDQIYDP